MDKKMTIIASAQQTVVIYDGPITKSIEAAIMLSACDEGYHYIHPDFMRPGLAELITKQGVN